MEVRITVSGEEDVGIPSDGATVSFEQWDYKDIDENDREEIRKLLKDCFKEIFDQGEPTVMFDNEIREEQEKRYKDYLETLSKDELIEHILKE